MKFFVFGQNVIKQHSFEWYHRYRSKKRPTIQISAQGIGNEMVFENQFDGIQSIRHTESPPFAVAVAVDVAIAAVDVNAAAAAGADDDDDDIHMNKLTSHDSYDAVVYLVSFVCASLLSSILTRNANSEETRTHIHHIRLWHTQNTEII